MLHIFEKQGLPTRLFPTIGAEGNEINVPRIYEQKCNFLYVGRLHVLKGVQFLLSALADARLNDAKLTVVGSGPDEKRLKKQAYEIGIGSRVTWIGQCRREELPSFYASHDVVVAPSMYESGGLVAIEAMEQGIPCIVIDVGGHAVSVSADCGIKIAPENSASKVIKDLANAMLKYKTNIELRKIHGNNARTRVRNNYGWQAKTTKILSLYNYLIDQSEKQLRR
jgi:glycosyltransferase involved in cell wall biosynthesis